jgi:hypothetical protein
MMSPCSGDASSYAYSSSSTNSPERIVGSIDFSTVRTWSPAHPAQTAALSATAQPA